MSSKELSAKVLPGKIPALLIKMSTVKINSRNSILLYSFKAFDKIIERGFYLLLIR